LVLRVWSVIVLGRIYSIVRFSDIVPPTREFDSKREGNLSGVELQKRSFKIVF
jgi:hypothetical protein